MHDAPANDLRRGFGVRWMTHFLPFQCSATATSTGWLVPRKPGPTAVHARADAHDTAARVPLMAGLRWLAQVAPFHHQDAREFITRYLIGSKVPMAPFRRVEQLRQVIGVCVSVAERVATRVPPGTNCPRAFSRHWPDPEVRDRHTADNRHPGWEAPEPPADVRSCRSGRDAVLTPVTSDRLMAYRHRRGRIFRSREAALTTMAGRLRRDWRARRRLTSSSASRSSASASMNSFTNVDA